MTTLQTSPDIIKNIFNLNINDCTARSWYFGGISSQYILHYVNPTLQESEFDVAMIQVGVEDPLNCQRDINQINNILQNIESIASKCR